MKTYEEMKDEVFRRVDDFEAEKKHRRKWKKTILVYVSTCWNTTT